MTIQKLERMTEIALYRPCEIKWWTNVTVKFGTEKFLALGEQNAIYCHWRFLTAKTFFVYFDDFRKHLSKLKSAATLLVLALYARIRIGLLYGGCDERERKPHDPHLRHIVEQRFRADDTRVAESSLRRELIKVETTIETRKQRLNHRRAPYLCIRQPF